MSNTNVVIDMVAKEALRIAHEKATFIGSVDRQWDDSFVSKGAGNIGSTLRVRNPNRYTRTQGSRTMVVQDQQEDSQTITLATQDHVDMRFNSAELVTDLDGFNEFSRRHIQPAIGVLISGIDGDCLATAAKQTFNLVGTAGTPVGTVTSGFSDTTALGLARAKINQGLAPFDDRSCQLDSVTMAYVANGVKNLFFPRDQINKAFTEGFVGRTAMADFYENEKSWMQACGSDHTTVTLATTHLAADGANTLTIVNGVGTVGDVFTIAGVYACHPETKAAYPHLQQFTVLTVVGSVAFTVSPTLYFGSTTTTAAKQNICTAAGAKVTTATFDSNPVVVMVGADSAVLRQNLMYQKEAFTFVTAPLPLMDDALKCSRVNKDGIGLRVWMASDIRNDEMLLRCDILYGFKVLRPEWACRITN